MGAGVEELGDIEFSAALQATVNQVALRGRDQVRADVFGELVWFHGASGGDGYGADYGRRKSACTARPINFIVMERPSLAA
jgi:hypothetical protein